VAERAARHIPAGEVEEVAADVPDPHAADVEADDAADVERVVVLVRLGLTPAGIRVGSGDRSTAPFDTVRAV
jgi:hypothetical protein